MNRINDVASEMQVLFQKNMYYKDLKDAYIHLYGVSHFCTLLALKRNLDIELSSIMGLLHDIYTYTNGYDKEHAKLGAEIAASLLKKLNIFTNDEISIISNSIFNHSDKKNIHDNYSELLKDADSIQNFLQMPFTELKHKKRIKNVMKEIGITSKLKEYKFKNYLKVNQMNAIITNYNLTIVEFRNTEKNTSVISIHKNINHLRKIESILLIFNLKLKHVRYGEKLFKLLKQLHEIQYKISTLEDSTFWEVSSDYLTYLKKQESDFIYKLNDFNNRKEIKFPVVKKKNIIFEDIYSYKAEKFLRKIEKFDAIQSNDIEDDVEELFEYLNKFNKYVIASSYIFIIKQINLTFIDTSLKVLNDIIRYENLISSLNFFYKKNIDHVENLIDFLDSKKMELVDDFENDKDNMLENCKEIVNQINNKEKN